MTCERCNDDIAAYRVTSEIINLRVCVGCAWEVVLMSDMPNEFHRLNVEELNEKNRKVG